jgi:hypothetical protein
MTLCAASEQRMFIRHIVFARFPFLHSMRDSLDQGRSGGATSNLTHRILPETIGNAAQNPGDMIALSNWVDGSVSTLGDTVNASRRMTLSWHGAESESRCGRAFRREDVAAN